MGKKRDTYFQITIRRKGKKSKKKNTGGKPEGRDTFWEVIGLSLILMLYMYLSFTFETLITSVNLFNIIATLGGLETYDQTVYGVTILIFIGGMAFIALRD